ncbi:cobalamin biosynthesis protein CobD [Acetobacterium bakii]|uniref:Cobalamin biosynthesis protein CobD n=1 Tax=Acetobacterium bakii TaxID=52689 RepID=A0A0L6TY35_9FIRM|nr:cobalamin biosynthesis protein CobD [Acetobacterium bakii]
MGAGGGFWFCLIFLGVLLDWVFGDPRWLPHPIIAMGKTISFLNEKLNRGNHRKAKGFLLLFLVLGLTGGIVFSIQYLLYQVHIALYLIFNLYLVSTSLAAKTLAVEVHKVKNALMSGNLAEARVQVGYLVGRDTTELTEKEIIRATVETTAENTIDGVLAPLFYMFIGLFIPVVWLNPGVLVMLYKATNTLDSMVGYVQEPYKDFGYASAKFDDLLNIIPARIGSIFMLLGGMVLGLNIKEGYRIYKRDRYNHKSPNSAHPESVVAGLLGIRLGGNNQYFGEVLEKPTIGDHINPLVVFDIRETVSIMYSSEVLVVIFSVIMAILVFSF